LVTDRWVGNQPSENTAMFQPQAAIACSADQDCGAPRPSRAAMALASQRHLAALDVRECVAAALRERRPLHVRYGSRLGHLAISCSMFGLPRRVQLVTATPLVVYRQEFRIPRSSVDVD